MTGPASPDDALVQAFLEGDRAAFDALVRRNEELVLRIVRRYARDAEDARDLGEKTFVRAFEAARRTFSRPFAERAPFRRWLVRIAVNLARNHARDAGRWGRASATDAEALPGGGQGPLAGLIDAERAARVRRAVLELPPRQREVLTLRLDAELPFSEIAAALEISENAAKVSFHHAAKRLRDLMRDGEERP
ncbi:MAG TPA: sigma-70 family RNA polymerase sigma factor [Anaeromyxobacteraceae bacterium]|nr:sigma-70 family RNA polymerase sigma factor [Anaeromyxobacteraceae bacterium]